MSSDNNEWSAPPDESKAKEEGFPSIIEVKSSSGGFAGPDEVQLCELRARQRHMGDVVFASDLAPLIQKESDMQKMKPKVQTFYKNQNRVIMGLLELDAMIKVQAMSGDVEPLEEEGDYPIGINLYNSGPNKVEMKRAQTAVHVSFGVNVVLFVLKVIAMVLSSSIAVAASALDSLLDILSSSMMFFLSRALHKKDPYKYPVSKSRLEPLGIIVFAAIMGMTSLHILEDAIEDMVEGWTSTPPSINVGVAAISMLLLTTFSKLFLFIYCKARGHGSSIVEALSQDHRNDVLTNSVALVCAVVASEFKSLWFADPVGALFLAMYILWSWVNAGKDQIGALVGKSAGPDFLNQLTYLAAHHDKRILRVDKCLAYHFGIRFMCEVDIVLPRDMPLVISHDIGEALESKIEQLPLVERAFVHIDYEWTHQPEHNAPHRLRTPRT